MTVFIFCAVLVIAAVVFTVFINWADGYPGAAVGFGLLVAVMGSMFGILACLLLTLIISPIVGYSDVTEKQRLIALTDERNSMGGAFFLGTGVIGSNASYTFYTVKSNGAREMHQESASGIQVYEDSAEPYVVWLVDCKSHHPAIVDCFPDRTHVLLEVHVPPRSIKTGIQMGVQP